jgi:hypothetical protein
VNRLVPLLAALFFGLTIPLILVFIFQASLHFALQFPDSASNIAAGALLKQITFSVMKQNSLSDFTDIVTSIELLTITIKILC